MLSELKQQSKSKSEPSCYSPNNPSVILAPGITVATCAEDVFGPLYSVSKGLELLGTFYQDLNGKWVIQAESEVQVNNRFETKEQAILIIAAVTGNLVIDVAA